MLLEKIKQFVSNEELMFEFVNVLVCVKESSYLDFEFLKFSCILNNFFEKNTTANEEKIFFI